MKYFCGVTFALLRPFVPAQNSKVSLIKLAVMVFNAEKSRNEVECGEFVQDKVCFLHVS